MNDALLVRDVERVADLDEQPRRARLGEASLDDEHVEEVLPLEQLHRHVEELAVDAPVDDAHRVRVLQVRRGLRFPAEAPDERRVGVHVRVHDLERDLARLSVLLGAVDLGHRALADEAGDAEAPRDRPAEERLRLSHARELIELSRERATPSRKRPRAWPAPRAKGADRRADFD